MSLSRDDGPGTYDRTMLVDLRQIRPTRPWKPFYFQNLERVSRTQVGLSLQVQRMLPPASAAEPLYARLKALFDAESRVNLVSVQIRPFQELQRYLGDPSFLAVLAPGALKERVVLEVELPLAHNLVDMLLGGVGETVGLRPLTDIEEGVMSFVVLEALKALAPALDPSLPKLRLETVARGAEEVADRLGEEDRVVVIHLNASLGPHTGLVRLVIPTGVVGAAELAQAAAERRSQVNTDLQLNRWMLSTVRTWLRAEIGQAEIASQDLAYIRVKDVVLLDALTARPDRGEEGTAVLRVGMGSSRVEAEVFLEDGQYKARVTSIVIGEPAFQRAVPPSPEGEEAFTQPETDGSSESEGQSLDTMNKSEGSDLLADIPLQIAVELARVPVTADEVVSLRVGHVLELHRSPGEPVELSVNGKVVARGELVEVEGQLGVRVLSLAG
ncbi:type III secretion system cytoplasmic ring protein SctQ [Stigmatella aurantiaca]|uniref:Flagellar motor switch protein FliM n=1 Tax=Stigmatella aurantiaca (strain DW4/3-1) TaxID=378806 RepID=Q08UP6_STIAD|nr:type III secretion system cytoplasmic ring protein SctQ [Stigmatella aurantiaca]ADO70836.1 Type III secretion system apparatus protein YscQ/HrcQ [Stigmatella aurantiaca DW4/3-1]EAU64213.1 type III secretion apparatus protein, YscQ/HrcQ family [Stigmatella aurantiaca DW4/3-1]